MESQAKKRSLKKNSTKEKKNDRFQNILTKENCLKSYSSQRNARFKKYGQTNACFEKM